MFRKKLFIIGLLLISLFLLGSCSVSPDEEIKASFGQEFTLSVGQTALFDGDNLKIKFASVSADSRCPKGVTCVWAGEAKCQVLIGNDKSFATIDLIESGGTSGYSETLYQSNNYNLKLSFRLEPYPEKDKQIDGNDYKLILTVTKLN